MLKIELNPYTGPYDPKIDLPGTSRIIDTYNQGNNEDLFMFKEHIYTTYKDSRSGSIFKFSVFEFNLRSKIYVEHDEGYVSIHTQQEFEKDFKIVEEPIDYGVGTVLPKWATLIVMTVVLSIVIISLIKAL